MRRATRLTMVLLTTAAIACGGDDPKEPEMSAPIPFTPPPSPALDAGPTQRPSLAQNGQLLVDPGGRDGTLVSQAIVTLTPTKKDGKGGGVVRFAATPTGIRLRAELRDLVFLSNYALYVHLTGDCSADDASSAGPPFNFDGSSLDPPDIRYGALGEVAADVSGDAKGDGKVPGAALQGPYSIIGRAVVLHATSGDANKPAYAAGAALACGVVGVAAELSAGP